MCDRIRCSLFLSLSYRLRSSSVTLGWHRPSACAKWPPPTLSPGTAWPAAPAASPLMNPPLAAPWPSSAYCALSDAHDASRTSDDRSAPLKPSVRRAATLGPPGRGWAGSGYGCE